MQAEVQKDLQIDQLYCTQKQQKFVQTLFIKKCAGKANNMYAKLLVRMPLMVLKYEILPNVSYSGFVYMFQELTNKVHLYLIDKKEYRLLNIDCTISDGAANCQYQNEIYFVGGSVLDNKKGYYVEIKQVHKVNLKGQSYKFSDLTEERSGCGAIILNKCLYAIGGYNKKQGPLSSVEMLDLTNKSEKFKTIQSLNIPRHHLTIIGFKNYIFAMGGANNTTQKSIEQYSQPIELPFPLSNIGAFTPFFIFGGYDGYVHQNQINIFNQEAMQWQQWQIKEGFEVFSSVLKKGNFCYCWGQNKIEEWKVYKVRVNNLDQVQENCEVLYNLGKMT